MKMTYITFTYNYFHRKCKLCNEVSKHESRCNKTEYFQTWSSESSWFSRSWIFYANKSDTVDIHWVIAMIFRTSSSLQHSYLNFVYKSTSTNNKCKFFNSSVSITQMIPPFKHCLVHIRQFRQASFWHSTHLAKQYLQTRVVTSITWFYIYFKMCFRVRMWTYNTFHLN